MKGLFGKCPTETSPLPLNRPIYFFFCRILYENASNFAGIRSDRSGLQYA